MTARDGGKGVYGPPDIHATSQNRVTFIVLDMLLHNLPIFGDIEPQLCMEAPIFKGS